MSKDNDDFLDLGLGDDEDISFDSISDFLGSLEKDKKETKDTFVAAKEDAPKQMVDKKSIILSSAELLKQVAANASENKKIEEKVESKNEISSLKEDSFASSSSSVSPVIDLINKPSVIEDEKSELNIKAPSANMINVDEDFDKIFGAKEKEEGNSFPEKTINPVVVEPVISNIEDSSMIERPVAPVFNVPDPDIVPVQRSVSLETEVPVEAPKEPKVEILKDEVKTVPKTPKVEYKIVEYKAEDLIAYQLSSSSESARIEGGTKNSIHINVGTSTYGWNVFFANGAVMSLPDLRIYQSRNKRLLDKSGKITYGNKTFEFNNINKITFYENPKYYRYKKVN